MTGRINRARNPNRLFGAARLLLALALAGPMTLWLTTTGASAESTGAPADSSLGDSAEVTPGVSGSIQRLYLSALGRDPDTQGSSYWVDRYVNGLSLAKIAESFLSSPEWQRRMGELDNEEFLAMLYENVLGRDPDPDGLGYWLEQSGLGLSRVEIVLWFSESEEFVRRTNTAPPESPPFPALPPESGQGRRIVYSDSQQRVWVVDVDLESESQGERLVDSYLVSGRAGVPEPGQYRVYSKSARAWAGHDGITMNHMVRFAWGTSLSIGFHSIPRLSDGTPMQTESELGSYQSAGCVRQNDQDAEALYHWANVGDLVVVVE